MVKFTLELEQDFDFFLLGIFCHVKDYRMSWFLNKALNIDLKKSSNLILSVKKIDQEHSLQEYVDAEDLKEYYLISNRSTDGWLIPEEKCDYFLMLKGHFLSSEIEDIRKKIQSQKPVLTVSAIEVDALKSKENLLF